MKIGVVVDMDPVIMIVDQNQVVSTKNTTKRQKKKTKKQKYNNKKGKKYKKKYKKKGLLQDKIN